MEAQRSKIINTVFFLKRIFHHFSAFCCFLLVMSECLKVQFVALRFKYISSSELKTSKFSLVLRTRDNFDVFNSLDEIYLVFTSKK